MKICDNKLRSITMEIEKILKIHYNYIYILNILYLIYIL